jgi:2-polyprenyl-6-methoxyphenol hydroxylase-like FAD-dependent oxidoreductase
LIIDKHHTRRGQPKAHALNPRTLEIFRQTGLDVVKIRELGIKPADVDVVRFVENFYGWEFGSLKYERQFDDVKTLTPEPLVNISQPLVEEYLSSEVAKLRNVTVKKGVEWLDIEPNADKQAKSIILNRETGEQFTIKTKFILACDGARANSRQAFGIGFNALNSGKSTEKHHITIHFRAQLPGKSSRILFFNMQPNGVRAFIRYGEEEWVYVRRFDPKRESPSDFDDSTCHKMIYEALGKEVDLKILSSTIWQSSTKVADKYCSDLVENAFLAGDAAHTFPPTGGLGVNTGFADIHNLIWKIDAVLQSVATDHLLDSYEQERRPVAIANAGQSAINEVNMNHLGVLINPSGQTGQQHQRWRDIDFQKQILEAIEYNSSHFNSLDLQLGYVYGQSRTAGQPVSQFIPTFTPGSRLPHVYLAGSDENDDKQRSVLDIVNPNCFVFICPADGLWQEVELGLPAHLKTWVRPVVLGQDFTIDNETWLDEIFGNSQSRGVLVRPDQHIVGFADSSSAFLQLITKFLHL